MKYPALFMNFSHEPLRTSPGWPCALADPLAVRRAFRRREVAELVDWAERQSLAGHYVVLVLAYEAAAAFDPALETHDLDEQPYAFAAVYDDEADIPLPGAAACTAGPFMPSLQRAEYDANIARIRELIRQGETYQVNYTFPSHGELSGDPLACFLGLGRRQQAGYSAFVDMGDAMLLSLSPELFFERTGRRIRARPMKGTSRRTGTDDHAEAAALARCPKNRAENVMIVDLLRNDLGRVAVPGGVRAPELFTVEKYGDVWQMTSTVEAELRSGVSLVDLFGALFPCGSVTGAPKVRTMQIIRDLEPAPRGVYCGAIGLLRPGGDCVFNVPIRTLVRERSDAARVHVGGGITWDSRAGGEYAECLDKLVFLDESEDFHIIEALLWEDGSYFLLERHLDRMAEAAAHFGRRFDHDAARELLADTGRAAPDPAKVRLKLDRAGTLAAEAVSIDPTTPTQRVAFAGQPVDSADPALARKTTRREIYKRALAAAGDVDDVILWNERGEATESTRANLVVELEGRLYTPPVACGLLPGTFRAELVERGEVAERVLTLEDVRQARALWLVNSVRRWMAAELAD